MTTTRSSERTPRRPSQPAGSARRARLLDIAARQFATRGYSQTTVRDIADEAGILSGSLYHHFSSKEAMLDEILRGFLSDLYARFQEIETDGRSPRDVLDALIRHAFVTIEESPDEVALYQNESRVIGQLSGFEYVIETSGKIERTLVHAIQAGQAAGDFRADLDFHLVYRLIRDSVWSVVRWYRPGGTLEIATVADQYLEVLHGGFLVPVEHD